jgi:hypothetical protein
MIKTTQTATLCLILVSSLPLAMGQGRDKDFPLRGVAEREIRQSDLHAFLEAIRTNDLYLATAILQAGRTNDRFWGVTPCARDVEHHL